MRIRSIGSRRLAAALVTGALVVALPGSAGAAVDPLSVPRIKLAAQPSPDLLINHRIPNSSSPSAVGESTVHQSFAFDSRNRRLFIAQLFDKDRDNIRITGYDISTATSKPRFLGQMVVKNAGHGVGIGVLNGTAAGERKTDSYLWTEAVKSGSGDSARGTALMRFRWKANSTASGKKYFTGSNTISAAVDGVTETLLVRRKVSGVWRLGLYRISDVLSKSSPKPLYDSLVPASVRSQTMQGFTVLGRYVYFLTGDKTRTEAVSQAAKERSFNSTLWTINLVSGRKNGKLVEPPVLEKTITKAGRSLLLREPEGLAVQSVGSTRRLAIGFASATARKGTKSSGKYRVNLYYKKVTFKP